MQRGNVNYIQFEYTEFHRRTEEDFEFLDFFVDVKIMTDQIVSKAILDSKLSSFEEYNELSVYAHEEDKHSFLYAGHGASGSIWHHSIFPQASKINEMKEEVDQALFARLLVQEYLVEQRFKLSGYTDAMHKKCYLALIRTRRELDELQIKTKMKENLKNDKLFLSVKNKMGVYMQKPDTYGISNVEGKKNSSMCTIS